MVWECSSLAGASPALLATLPLVHIRTSLQVWDKCECGIAPAWQGPVGHSAHSHKRIGVCAKGGKCGTQWLWFMRVCRALSPPHSTALTPLPSLPSPPPHAGPDGTGTGGGAARNPPRAAAVGARGSGLRQDRGGPGASDDGAHPGLSTAGRGCVDERKV